MFLICKTNHLLFPLSFANQKKNFRNWNRSFEWTALALFFRIPIDPLLRFSNLSHLFVMPARRR